MAKQSGLGGRLWVGGAELSGDIQDFAPHGGMAPLDVTDITQSAHSRLGGLRDGAIALTSYFDPALAHPVLSALPTADVITTAAIGAAIGSPAVSQNSVQLNYDGTRAADGGFTFKVDAQADGFGQEWGVLLTAGTRTDTSGRSGTSFDTGASASFGAQAYLHVISFTGTSVTVNVDDSADNTTFTAVAGLTFTAATAIGAQRIAIGNTATVREFVRVTTAGTFTNAQFAVVLVKNNVAGQVF